MNNLINFLNINHLLPTSENSPIIQISKLSPELLAVIQNNKSAILEVLINTDGKVSHNLLIDNQVFLVELKNSLILDLTEGSIINIPVKIGTSGRLYPQLQTEKTQSLLPQEQIITNHIPISLSNDKGVNIEVDLSPIKLKQFVETTLQDIKVSSNIKQQIIDIVGTITANITKVGNKVSQNNELVLQPLQNIIRQIATNPENLVSLKTQLETEVNNLIGQQIDGKIIKRVNDTTTVKTALGDTFFNSKVKLPLNENVIVNISSKISSPQTELQFIDNLIKTILPENKNLVDFEHIMHSENSKPLLRLSAEIPTNILHVVFSKLPFQPNNLFESIYNFYQATIKGDISKWLGKDTLKNISHNNSAETKIISELNNFVSTALKETPSWRIVEIPMFDGNQINILKFAVKKDSSNSQKSKHKKQNGTRFIVETEFSKLGSFQFDGFSNIAKRNLDLIIRTGSLLSDDFCSNIINLFKKSLYNLNYSGTIRINKQESFINLQDTNTINEGIYI